MATRNLSYLSVPILAASTSTVCTIPTGENGCQRLGMIITAGDQALDVFEVEVSCGKDGPFVQIAAAAGTYSTAVDPLVRTVGTPATLASAASAFLLINTHGIGAVRIKASSAVANSTISIETSLG